MNWFNSIKIFSWRSAITKKPTSKGSWRHFCRKKILKELFPHRSLQIEHNSDIQNAYNLSKNYNKITRKKKKKKLNKWAIKKYFLSSRKIRAVMKRFHCLIVTEKQKKKTPHHIYTKKFAKFILCSQNPLTKIKEKTKLWTFENSLKIANICFFQQKDIFTFTNENPLILIHSLPGCVEMGAWFWGTLFGPCRKILRPMG